MLFIIAVVKLLVMCPFYPNGTTVKLNYVEDFCYWVLSMKWYFTTAVLAIGMFKSYSLTAAFRHTAKCQRDISPQLTRDESANNGADVY